MNRLDLFDAVKGLTFGLNWQDENAQKEVRNAMENINSKLARVVDGMGGLRLYLGREAIDDDLLANAGSQMKGNIETIGQCADKGEVQNVEELLDHICGFIYLRIRRARNLPNKDAGVFFEGSDLTDAYVLIRMGDTKRKDCPSTRVIKDNLHPVWDEEFVLPVPATQRKLTLEVFDSDDDAWVGSKRESIGYLQVEFRNHQATWVERNEHLHYFQSRKNLKSKLEYSFFYVTCIKQLGLVEGVVGPTKTTKTSATG